MRIAFLPSVFLDCKPPFSFLSATLMHFRKACPDGWPIGFMVGDRQEGSAFVKAEFGKTIRNDAVVLEDTVI